MDRVVSSRASDSGGRSGGSSHPSGIDYGRDRWCSETGLSGPLRQDQRRSSLARMIQPGTCTPSSGRKRNPQATGQCNPFTPRGTEPICKLLEWGFASVCPVRQSQPKRVSSRPRSSLSTPKIGDPQSGNAGHLTRSHDTFTVSRHVATSTPTFPKSLSLEWVPRELQEPIRGVQRDLRSFTLAGSQPSPSTTLLSVRRIIFGSAIRGKGKMGKI
jgi:hypothetical protein